MPTKLINEPALDQIHPPARPRLGPPLPPPLPPPPPTWWWGGWSHRRKVTVTVLAGMALLAGSAGAWWARAVTADPGLSFVRALNVVRSTEPGSKAGITDLRNALGHEAQVEVVPGGRFVAWVNLRNDGARDVRVKGIPARSFFSWAFDGAVIDDPGDGEEPGRDEVPFAPFTLKAGDSVPLRLEFRFARCSPGEQDRDGSMTLKTLPLDYTVLGVRQSVQVSFDEMAITVSTAGTCDHPIPEPNGDR